MTSSQDDNSDQEFKYLLSTEGPVAVVTFVGTMDSGSMVRLEECQQNLLTYVSSSCFIIYMRDVANISGDAIPFITQLQKNLRAKGEVKLCSINPTLKEKLTKMGIIRGREVFDNLRLALNSLPPSLRKTDS